MAITVGLERHGRSAVRVTETVFYALWRILTSVQYAILSVLAAGAASLVGVLLPQIPANVRAQPALTSAWLEVERGRFGPFTSMMHRLGLFDVFHAWWFWGLVGWVALAVTVCTYSRLPRIWRQVSRPPRRVPDALFDRETTARIAVSESPEMVERKLRRQRYKVSRVEERGATYLFADRFGWARLATFVSHLALIVFLAGAIVTRFDAFGTSLTIAEGASAPVFPVKHESQILVNVADVVGAFDEQGRPLDYHSDLVLYRNGVEAKRCTITVNTGCGLDGYNFHQAGFFGYGGELRVRDIETGNTVYREVLALDQQLPSPVVAVEDADGAVVHEGPVPQTDLVEGSLGALLPLADAGKVFWVGLGRGEESWTMVVFDPTDGVNGDRAFVPLGGEASVSGYTFRFAGMSSLPSLLSTGIPLPDTGGTADDGGQVLLALENAVFGTGDASAGDERLESGSGELPVLHMAGVAPVTVRLAEGEQVRVGPYDYEFMGTRDFSGISVRKDRGDALIWVAAGLFLFGLVLTLWVPRRRAWLRFRDGEMRVVSEGRVKVEPSELVGGAGDDEVRGSETPA